MSKKRQIRHIEVWQQSRTPYTARHHAVFNRGNVGKGNGGMYCHISVECHASNECLVYCLAVWHEQTSGTNKNTQGITISQKVHVNAWNIPKGLIMFVLDMAQLMGQDSITKHGLTNFETGKRQDECNARNHTTKRCMK